MTEITSHTPAFNEAVAALRIAVTAAMQSSVEWSIRNRQFFDWQAARDIVCDIPSMVRTSIYDLVKVEPDLADLANRQHIVLIVSNDRVEFWRGKGMQNLTTAHRLLFQYCQSAGLNPFIREKGAWRRNGYELCITLLLSKEQIDDARNRFNAANF